MNIKKLGAIDIGSNGVRLLISNVLEEPNEAPKFTKASLVRVPIRTLRISQWATKLFCRLRLAAHSDSALLPLTARS